MKYGNIILEKKEYVYIKRILNISGYNVDLDTQKSLKKFSKELKNAQIVDEDEMPADIIRFQSSVLVSSEKGWKKTLQIVDPVKKDIKMGKISILTPMGAALFGCSEADVVEWDFPNGKQQLKIETVTQEEQNKRIETPI